MNNFFKIEDKILEVLCVDHRIYPNFLIRYLSEKNKTYCDFEVYEVSSWGIDNAPSDIELYLKGTIKWDGCSHINFGDNKGYIHICGQHFWEAHVKMMEILYKTVSAKIENFDSCELWNS
jgi:hypothetical protein